MPDSNSSEITVESLPSLLENDTKVKVAGVDIDGILRGKLMAKKKFLSIAKEGFGFCSVIFGWDMHDMTYFRELKISNKENGYRDILAIPDLNSFRRIPWEDNVPFFLVSFYDPDTQRPLSSCPRGLLKTASDKLDKAGYGALAGGVYCQILNVFCLYKELANDFIPAEYEFYHFRSPIQSDQPSEANSSTAIKFLQENASHKLPSLTEGMTGYSLTRPVLNQEYYYGVFDTCEKFRCGIEGWHTESGPGVFEAVRTSFPLHIILLLIILQALEYGEIKEMADKAGLFK
jgi:glutamine synthetase